MYEMKRKAATRTPIVKAPGRSRNSDMLVSLRQGPVPVDVPYSDGRSQCYVKTGRGTVNDFHSSSPSLSFFYFFDQSRFKERYFEVSLNSNCFEGLSKLEQRQVRSQTRDDDELVQPSIVRGRLLS